MNGNELMGRNGFENRCRDRDRMPHMTVPLKVTKIESPPTLKNMLITDGSYADHQTSKLGARSNGKLCTTG